MRTFLEPEEFYTALTKRNIDFYTGVPDSLLKDFCAYVTDYSDPSHHIITANEGAAIAAATGYHLATKNFPLVYMQNSGLGNAINPLVSLADQKVYSIPMLVMVGWRGEPGKKDEPQHRRQGEITPGLLASLGLPFDVLPDYAEGAESVLDSAIQVMKERQCPFTLLVKRQTFGAYKLQNKQKADQYPLTREQFLELAMDTFGEWDVVVSTTGFASREVFELRVKRNEGHGRDFLTVGSMGHASAIALGVAVAKPSRQVFCLDGDGAMMMHMGNLVTAGTYKPENFKHIVINNGCHDSVGAQTTKAFDIDIPSLAKASGYRFAATASTEEEIRTAMEQLRKEKGPGLLEVRVRPGARKDLGRPTTTPIQNKHAFMNFLDN